MTEFEISFTNKEITPWGGMVFLQQMLHKIGFRELIEASAQRASKSEIRG